MKIIIAGAGDVGFHLAKLLAKEEHDIVLIDLDSEKLNHASNHLDVATIRGDSSSYGVLKEANVFQSDLLIAATATEENNLLTAIIASKLGVKKTVARISNTEFLVNRKNLNLKELGVDEIISPESLAAREIKRLVQLSAITDSFIFAKGELAMIGVHVEDQDPLNNKSLAESTHLNPDFDFLTVAVLRGKKTIIPRGNTRFQIGDHVYYIAQPSGVDRVLKLFNKKKTVIKNIMILGGSRVGYHTATKLSKDYHVKLIESNKVKCFDLADQLNDVLVINGDGTDVDLLKEEGIEEMDAFIAVTGNSETNIISSLVAKNHGVKKTIALVENMDYIHLSQNIGVDTMINKKLIAANFIFRYVRQGKVVSIAGIHGVDAEILEFEVPYDSKITQKPLKKLDFPLNAVVGGVIRDGKGLSPTGDFEFEAGDRVVVLVKPKDVGKVETFFV